ncbi:hypothetical protein E2C01_079240 [Portunus trituberculatus]|uniref:Uncharacterized protein n=1 Tax=Portunus trituberculatus TaxID=210409 RepID=A0A5B7IL03_PORTR|nr:hypothetical protein [Portunus trituberculatus]
MKEPNPHNTSARMNCQGLWGDLHSTTRPGCQTLTTMDSAVVMSVAMGGTDGSMVWLNSCTKPPVMLATPCFVTCHPSRPPATDKCANAGTV